MSDDLDKYRTDPVNAIEHASGRFKLASGGYVTVLPLVDQATGLFARLDFKGAEEAAKRLGGRLINRSEIDEVRDQGFVIDVVTLPTLDMEKAAGITYDSRDPMRWQEQVNAYRDPRMASRAWAEIMDAAIMAQLEDLDWSNEPVMNAGKWWFRNGPNSPPPGRAYLAGWWTHGAYIQGGAPDGTQGPHADSHFDYGTLTMVVFDSASVSN